MGVVEVRDYVLWPKHIYGEDQLRDELLACAAGALVNLVVDGTAGTWVKMNDGPDGTPTPGLKAIGSARTHWHRLFRTSRGALVRIEKTMSAPAVRADEIGPEGLNGRI